MVQQVKEVYSSFERIKYSYDFENYKILDHVSLSEALKQTNTLMLLTPATRKVPAINSILIKIANAKEQLINGTNERFN